ncbi:MAG: transforming growth factor-beta-induced protein [Verrucomicrobiales bacterium]|jgi:transforming growth factor-beta-induced protein
MIAALAASVQIASADHHGKKPTKTIVEIAAGNEDFSTLVAAVKAAGLAETLSSKGPFTVFAPTNAAFAKLPKGTVAELLKPENKEKLASILTYHVVGAKVMAKDVKAGFVGTVNGDKLSLTTEGGVKVDAANVVATDIVGSNGVIHVIDSVIMPGTNKTIVGIAAGNEDFSTLVAAVTAAGLVETLSGDGPFTVFAPTNAAFAKLPKGTVETLLKPENKEKLAAILAYHVVAAKVMAADVKPGKVKTVNGKKITIKVAGGKVMVDGAQVVKTDIVGTNGVIHVLDSVILPAE